jgi:excisionase family DNA binding protein
MSKIHKCRYAEMVVHTRCNAFVTTNGKIPYLNELLWEVREEITKPVVSKIDSSKCQGAFHYVHHRPSDLKLVCDDFDQQWIKYHVFFDYRHLQPFVAPEADYVIWTPEMDQYGNRLLPERGKGKIIMETENLQVFEDVEHCLMTLEEAAIALRLSRYTLSNWLSQGKIKRVKIGRRTFIARQEVQNLINSALRAGERSLT